ncbi:hypothetical protein J4W55_02385 [Escherichia coli]|nr:hypothetical protein [Escherichia coli]
MKRNDKILHYKGLN